MFKILEQISFQGLFLYNIFMTKQEFMAMSLPYGLKGVSNVNSICTLNSIDITDNEELVYKLYARKDLIKSDTPEIKELYIRI